MSRFVPLRRGVALANLLAAFPDSTEKQRRAIYRSMCRSLGVVISDFARWPLMSASDFVEYVDIEGMENLERVRDRAGGTLMLTGHFGNWELTSAVVASLGIPVTVLGARHRNPVVERLFTDYRIASGVSELTLRQGLKPLVETLRRGDVVGSLADQDGGADGFFVDFLGRPASVQAGLFRLAARMKVPVLTCFTMRAGTRWRMVCEPPFELEGIDPDRPEDVARGLATAYTRRLEARVREHPDHWFWVHRRWKTRPPGETGPDASSGR